MLIALSGLPGSGKTTLARSLSRRLGAHYLRIDTIEDILLAETGEAFVDGGAGNVPRAASWALAIAL